MMKETLEQPQGMEIVVEENETSYHFSLKRNGFEEKFCNGYRNLLYSGDLADVTLACDGQLIKAHKAIFAMCSPFFRKVFRENPCEHPTVILKDMKFREMQNILHLIYFGEVCVPKQEINEFIQAVDSLKIGGADSEPIIAKPPHQNDFMDRNAPVTSPQVLYEENRHGKREIDSFGRISIPGRHESSYHSTVVDQEAGERETLSPLNSKRCKSSSNVWDKTSAPSMEFSPKRYKMGSTVASSSRVMQTFVRQVEIRSDKIVRRRSDDSISVTMRTTKTTRTRMTDHCQITGTTELTRENVSSLPPEFENTESSRIDIPIYYGSTGESRNDFEPKPLSEISATASTSSPSITNPIESLSYRSTTPCFPSYCSPCFSMSTQQQNETANFSLRRGQSSTAGKFLSKPHTLPSKPVTSKLSCQSSSSATTQISQSASSAFSSHYFPSSSSKPTSTISSLGTNTTLDFWQSPRSGFPSYYPATSPLTASKEGKEHRPIGMISRKAQFSNPKTKPIRSSLVPPSSRFTAAEVDEIVDQVLHYPGDLVPCAICQKIVKREQLRPHINDCHLFDKTLIICPQCGIGLKSEGSYRVHMWRHKRGTLPSKPQHH